MAEPREIFDGTLVIIAPHMDDEALACGGLMAQLPQKENIHVIYATDGMKSPAPIVRGRDFITPDLGQVRMNESRAAMGLLGLPAENLHFLGLPEAELPKHLPELREALLGTLQRLDPDVVLIPFRYDRHPDHLAINHVITSVHQLGLVPAQVLEYFVYYRWRLLPGRDVRKYIWPSYLIEIPIQQVAKEKRAALACFTSQTTIYYPWQTRPILTSKLLDEECETPEYFLLADLALSGAAVFSGWVLWIRIAHRLEPRLLKLKYLMGAFWKRLGRASYGA